MHLLQRRVVARLDPHLAEKVLPGACRKEGRRRDDMSARQAERPPQHLRVAMARCGKSGAARRGDAADSPVPASPGFLQASKLNRARLPTCWAQS